MSGERRRGGGGEARGEEARRVDGWTSMLAYLSAAKLVLAVVDVQGGQQLLHSLPAVQKRVLRDR